MAKQLLKTLLLLCASMACTAAWADDEEEATSTTTTTTLVDIDFGTDSSTEITYTTSTTETTGDDGSTVETTDTTAAYVTGTKGTIYLQLSSYDGTTYQTNSKNPSYITSYGQLALGGPYYSTITIAEDDRVSSNKLTVYFEFAAGKYSGKYQYAYLKDSDGNNIAYFGIDRYNGNITTNIGLVESDFYTNGSYYGPSQWCSNQQVWDSHATGISIEIDYDSKVITTTTSQNTTNTYVVDLTNTNPVAYISFYNEAGTETKRNAWVDDIKVTATSPASGYGTVVVNYLTEGGDTLSADLIETSYPRTYYLEVGTYTTSSIISYPTSIETNSIAYNYSSGADGDITVTDGETTTVNLIYSKQTRTFSITAVDEDNNTLYTYDSGTGYLSYTLTGITQFIEQDGAYYELNDDDVSDFQKTFTYLSDDDSYTVSYKKNENVVYYTETGSNVYSTSTATDCSGGSYSSYNYASTYYSKPILSQTLPQGYYNCYTKVYSHRGSGSSWQTLVMYVDYIQGNSGKPSSAGSTLTLPFNVYNTEGSSVILAAAWTSDNYDYFYIEKITDKSYDVSVSSLGIASFCAPVNVIVPDGITVYSASLDDEKTTLTLSEVETNVIPANTGVILQGSEETYTFEQTDDESSADFDENDLIAACATAKASTTLTATTTTSTEESTDNGDGTTTTTTTSTTTTYYALAKSSTDTSSAVFAKIAASITVTDKAYLAISTTSTSQSTSENTSTDEDETDTAAKTIKIVFAETSGIESVSSEKQTDGSYYNLQGVKVLSPSKGLYIKDGKKVIIK